MAISIDSLLATGRAGADAAMAKNTFTAEELRKEAIRMELELATSFKDMQERSAQAFAENVKLEKIKTLSGLFTEQKVASSLNIPGVTQ